MGAVDLVVQIEAPPSVAAGLQRVGRAGHQVGAVSRGVVFPKHRGDLLSCAVVAERMHAGLIEEMRYPRNPLDVLAQQIVAMVAMDAVAGRRPGRAGPPGRALRRAARPRALEATLDMLSGRYPSTAFAELRPRIVWDRAADLLTGRPGAQRLAVTSGGTIPDRGPVRGLPGRRRAGAPGSASWTRRWSTSRGSATSSCSAPPPGASRRSRPDRVLVSPAPGAAARMPFWKGDQPGPPGRAGPGDRRQAARARQARPRRRPRADLRRRPGWTPWAVDNLLSYVDEQREATRHLPDDRTVLVERFRDELGDWRLAVHCLLGAKVNGAWALAIGRRLTERYGVDAQVLPSDDGIVVRLPDMVDTSGLDAPPGADLVVFDPDEIAAAGRGVDRRLGDVRRPVPRVRRPVAAAAPPRPAPPPAAVAAAPAGGPTARRGPRVRRLPGHPGGGPRVPAGRARRARPGRADARHRRPAGPAGRGGDASGRRRSPGRCSSATSAPSSTAATCRWPNGGRPRWRWTPPCSASCWAGWSCASCSTRRWWSRPSAGCSGSTAARTLRDAEDVVELLRVLGDLSTAECVARGAAGRLARRAGRAPGACRRSAIAGEARWSSSRTPAGSATRSGWRCRSGWPSAYLEPVRRPDRRPGRPLRPHPRPVHRRRPARPGSASGVFVVEQALKRLGRRRPGDRRRVHAGHVAGAAAAPSGATPRCCGCCAGGRWPRCAARSSPCRRPRWPRFLPRWQQVGSAGPRRRGGGRGARAAAGRARSRPRPGNGWCCRPGSPTTPRPTSTSSCASGEVLWAGPGSIPGGDGWIAFAWADVGAAAAAAADRRVRRRPGARRACSTRSAAAQALFFRPARRATARRDRRRPTSRRAGGAVGPGLGRPGLQRHARPGPGAARRRRRPQARAAAPVAGTAPPARLPASRLSPGLAGHRRGPGRRPRPAAGTGCPTATPTRPAGPPRSPRRCWSATACSPGAR